VLGVLGPCKYGGKTDGVNTKCYMIDGLPIPLCSTSCNCNGHRGGSCQVCGKLVGAISLCLSWVPGYTTAQDLDAFTLAGDLVKTCSVANLLMGQHNQDFPLNFDLTSFTDFALGEDCDTRRAPSCSQGGPG
jgi:hypothetical protein